MTYYKISSIIFLGFTLLWANSITAQRSNAKIVQGNGENIDKVENTIVSTKFSRIELQVIGKDKLPMSNARILIVELEKMIYTDSLGNVSLELPDNMLNAPYIQLTISKRERTNSGFEKIYKKKITINMNDASEKRKIILSHFKKVKSLRCTITPSF